MLNSFKAVKTKCIKIKSMWIICTSSELGFKIKKIGVNWGSYFYFPPQNPENKTEFADNSLNSPKIRKLNIDTLIIPQDLSINEKNQSSKISCYCPFKKSNEHIILQVIMSTAHIGTYCMHGNRRSVQPIPLVPALQTGYSKVVNSFWTGYQPELYPPLTVECAVYTSSVPPLSVYSRVYL